VTVSYSRNGRDRQTTVTLGEVQAQGWSRIYESNDPWKYDRSRPKIDDEDFYSSRPKLGVAVEDLADGKGVRILSVKPNSPAEIGGLRTDDVVTSIDGIRVENVDDLQRVVGNLRPGNKIRLNIIRGGDRLSKMITMPKPKDVRDF
jgi:S1-C subfamily serine protease